jgi:hypothetical protein
MNDDGTIDVSDAVTGLMHLFVTGDQLPGPNHEGQDDTADALMCER